LPKTIALLKTTGTEEGQAFYPRDTAIVFPAHINGKKCDAVGKHDRT
jgi:hypothetical protein